MSSILETTLPLLMVGLANARYTGPTTQAGIQLIENFEGFRPNFYLDPVGIKTIGYGHACHVHNCSVPLNGKYPVPLSLSDGEKLLMDDLQGPGGSEPCVANAVTYSNFNANQFSALVSFSFNLGCGALRGSTLLKKLNKGDIPGAADEFGKWIHAKGTILPGLVKRRDAERDMFCSGGLCRKAAKICTGVAYASGSLVVRSAPYNWATVAGKVPYGTVVTLLGRVSGDSVIGNPYWYKISTGFVTSFYINIVTSNGEDWCRKR